MKISVSSYSFNQYIKKGLLDHVSVVEKASQMGFKAIEFIDLPGENMEEQLEMAEKIKNKADELGMVINAYTVSANLYWESEEENKAEVERLKRQVDVAKVLGAKVMRHDSCWILKKTGNGRSFDLMLPTIAKNAREISDYAQLNGIKTCTENHGYIAQDSDRMERLFNAVNHDNYGLLVDVGNFACADEDSCHAVSRLAPYAIYVHVKDFIKYNDSSQTNKKGFATRGMNFLEATAVGTGDIPVKKCIQILKRAEYDGYVSIEYEGSDDCIEGIATGLKNLKEMING